MQYIITFKEYAELGGVLDVTAFNRYSIRVFSVLDRATYGRLRKMSVIPDAVKHLCRDLVEYFYNNVTQEKTIVSASQSQGGTSESETYANKTAENHEQEINDLIYDYLAMIKDDNGTPLLYRGCDYAK